MNSTIQNVLRPCPICASVKARRLHHQRFALPPGHPLPTAFDVVSCPVCDFVYADTAAGAEAYDRYYADYSKYADQGTGTGGGGNLRDQARIDATARDIARQMPDRSARIVDIGCANGGVLGALRQLGYENLLGVDPSPECVANTIGLFGVPAKQGWLGALPAEAVGADLIILSHVLEHVLDLTDAVARLRAALAPGGVVYVEVPDASRYTEYLIAPFQDFNTEHINHFSLAALGNLFGAGGFTLDAEGQKLLPNAGNTLYPACFGFFRYAASNPLVPPWRRAPEFLAAIDRYIKLSAEQLAAIDARLATVGRGPFIVWGVGQLTLKLMIETCLSTAAIAAFTDGNPMHHGKTLQGRPILSPESLRDLPPHPMVIGSLLHQEAIVDRIRNELKLANPIVTLA